MEEREAIALNVQLPAGALEGFTRLVEQLRYLVAEVSGSRVPVAPGTAVEAGQNPGFDLRRFQGLEQDAAPVQAAASRHMGREIMAAPGANAELSDIADTPPGEMGFSSLPIPREWIGAEIPAAYSAGTPAVWTEVEEGAAVQSRAASAPETPGAAGTVVSDGPETAGRRPYSAAEEGSGAERASLTAQDISQAFRRDGRRYDNAFPLY